MIKIKVSLLQILIINLLNSVNWHFTCQLTLIYENLKERYFGSIQSKVDCFKDSESDCYDKNDMKEKLDDFARNDLNITKTCS